MALCVKHHYTHAFCGISLSYGQQVAGTHPTGMLSCCLIIFNVMYHSIYYRPQRSWGKVMFLHVSVILFTGGVSLSACSDTPPRSRTPLGADTTPPPPPPTGADTPQEETRKTPPRKKPGRPPQRVVHAGRYGQQAGSYWNALLFWSESRTCI